MLRVCLLFLIFCLAACGTKAASEPTPYIVIDQFGYLPELDKRAIIRSPELVGGPNPWYERDVCCKTKCGGYSEKICKRPIYSPPAGQPPMKAYAEFNDGWPLNS